MYDEVGSDGKRRYTVAQIAAVSAAAAAVRRHLNTVAAGLT